MATMYCTWAEVIDWYPRAADVVATGSEQTALIERATEAVKGYLRPIHKGDLTAPYDSPVKEATAGLVVEELRRKRRVNPEELIDSPFKHNLGELLTEDGIRAHSRINSILMGHLVLSQDHAEKDIHKPEPVVVQHTGDGDIRTVLPYAYSSYQVDTYRILCTTAGRVDDESAKFSIWKNYDTATVSTGVSPTGGLQHLDGGLYVVFQDGAADANDSFDLNDEWLITAIPASGETRTPGVRQVAFFPG